MFEQSPKYLFLVQNIRFECVIEGGKSNGNTCLSYIHDILLCMIEVFEYLVQHQESKSDRHNTQQY